MEQKRDSFSGKIGFILAAAGSAVGLGNIWRFPYLAAKYGGGIFILIYIILALTLGFTLMVTDIAIGRKVQKSVVGAFKALNKKWAVIGVMATLISVLIVPYYCVLGGWVTKYFVAFVTGDGLRASDASYFGNFVSSTWEPLIWFVIYLLTNVAISLGGVQKGIEKVSKILMPLLMVLLVLITIYTLTMPGAWGGVCYYLVPDFSKFSLLTLAAAAGQMFFSMSLGLGTMVTYGSYMGKTDSIESSAKQVEWFDTGIALLAGLMIVPAVFAFSGGSTSALRKGPELLFVTMPQVFQSMGAFGPIAGTAFFLTVFFAAITSSISMIETFVSVLQEWLKMKRLPACLLASSTLLVMGIPSSLGFGLWKSVQISGMSLLDIFDFTANNLGCPIVAFLTCLLVGYVIKPKTVYDEMKNGGNAFKNERMCTFILKYVAPLLLILIFVVALLEGLGVVRL